MKLPDARVRQDKKYEIARAVRSYQRDIEQHWIDEGEPDEPDYAREEMLWGDMIFDLSWKLNLQEETCERIAREAV